MTRNNQPNLYLEGRDVPRRAPKHQIAIRATLCSACLIFVCATQVSAVQVTVDYQAEAATVVGTPFGLTVPLGTPISGFFVYDTATSDSDLSPTNGLYNHTGGGGFSADVLGTLIGGSATPRWQVGVMDTLRAWDGPPEGGNMTVNGSPDPNVDMFLAITPSDSNLLPDDSLPDPWPAFDFGFLGDPHTFTLSDGTGDRILLQFNSTTQRPSSPGPGPSGVPEPSTLVLGILGLIALSTRSMRCRAKR